MPEPESAAQGARRFALGRLARRDYSAEEMRGKLRERGFDQDVVDGVAAALIREGALSDARFAENYVRSRRLRGYGPVRIRAELSERGIAEALIARYVDPRDPEWVATSAAVRRKRFGAELPDEFREQARQMRFLQYRGFDTEQIRAALRSPAESSV